MVRWITWATLALVVAVVAAFDAPVVRADGGHSHFRFGHITWEQVSGNTVDFTFVFGARANGYGNGVVDPVFGVTVFNCPTCAPGAFAGVGDVIDETIGGTFFCFGDGACTGQLQFKVFFVNAADNWLLARALEPGSATDETLTHGYGSAGPFTAFIDTCCRISGAAPPNAHINNPDGGYRLETIVNLNQTSASPRSLLPAIVDCPQDDVCSFFVTAVDPDGQPLRWRFSASGEASSFSTFIQPGPPQAPNAASVDANSGLYSWNTTGATLGPVGFQTLYSTQVTIEDLDGAGNVASKSAIDFFIRLVPGQPPVVPPQSPTINPCGLTLTVAEGNLLQFTMTASDPDAGDLVTLGVIDLPAGAAFPIPAPGNPVSSTFSWTPAPGQAGSYMVVFTATDSSGISAPPCVVAIVVEEAPALRYLATGDSVACGEDLQPEGEDCPFPSGPQPYPDHLCDKLQTLDSYECKNISVSGATSTDYVVSQLPQAIVGTETPRLVTVTIGGNDWFGFLTQMPQIFDECRQFVSMLLHVPLADKARLLEACITARAVRAFAFSYTLLTENLNTILEGLSANPNMIVIVSNYYNPLSGATGFRARTASLIGAALVAPLNLAIENTVGAWHDAFGERIQIADIKRQFEGHGVGSTDPWIVQTDEVFGVPWGIHPNEAGHICIANVIWEVSKSTLGSSEMPASDPCP